MSNARLLQHRIGRPISLNALTNIIGHLYVLCYSVATALVFGTRYDFHLLSGLYGMTRAIAASIKKKSKQ